MRTFRGILVLVALFALAAVASAQEAGIGNVSIRLQKESGDWSAPLPTDEAGRASVKLNETGTYRLILTQKAHVPAVLMLEARTLIVRPGVPESQLIPHILAVPMRKPGQLMKYDFDVHQPGTEFRVTLSALPMNARAGRPAASARRASMSGLRLVSAKSAAEAEYASWENRRIAAPTAVPAEAEPADAHIITIAADQSRSEEIPVSQPGIYELRFEQDRAVTAPYTFQASIGGNQMGTAQWRSTVTGPGVVWRQRVKIITPDSILKISVSAQ